MREDKRIWTMKKDRKGEGCLRKEGRRKRNKRKRGNER